MNLEYVHKPVDKGLKKHGKNHKQNALCPRTHWHYYCMICYYYGGVFMIGTIDSRADLRATGISLRYGWPHLAGLESEGFLEGWKLGFLLGYLAGERDHAAGRHDIASAYAASSRID